MTLQWKAEKMHKPGFITVPFCTAVFGVFLFSDYRWLWDGQELNSIILRNKS